MASQILASIYRIGDTDLKSSIGTPATMGVDHGFPTNLVRFYPITGVTANGITMQSVIALLPNGLNQPVKKFYTAAAVSALVTASNA
jgi:hypothetical protein